MGLLFCKRNGNIFRARCPDRVGTKHFPNISQTFPKHFSASGHHGGGVRTPRQWCPDTTTPENIFQKILKIFFAKKITGNVIFKKVFYGTVFLQKQMETFFRARCPDPGPRTPDPGHRTRCPVSPNISRTFLEHFPYIGLDRCARTYIHTLCVCVCARLRIEELAVETSVMKLIRHSLKPEFLNLAIRANPFAFRRPSSRLRVQAAIGPQHLASADRALARARSAEAKCW